MPKLLKKVPRGSKNILLGLLVLASAIIILVLTQQASHLNNQALILSNQAATSTQRIREFHHLNLDFQKIASLSAERKRQGVSVATVEASLEKVRQEIQLGNFASPAATLKSLNNALDSLLREQLEKDKVDSELARKKAAEEARKKIVPSTTTPISQTQPTADPNSLGEGYSRTSIATKNGNFTISLIKVNLAGRQVIMDSANDNDCANACPTKSLAEYVSGNKASYGINGTYFCPPDYASCAGKVSSFDFPIFNTRLGRWINQGNLYWTNRAMMTFPLGGAAFYPNASSGPTGGFNAAIVSSPGLVQNGQDIVGQYSLTSAQTTKGSRGGLGIKGSTLYMVIASGASVPDLAAIFQALGVNHAMNIDGGGSSAMWAGGYKVGPGRNLPNALMVR